LATELKSIKYSRGAKAAAGILIWLFFMAAVGSSAFLLHNWDNLTTENYFKTKQFKTEFYRLVHNTVEFNVILKNEENIKASGEAEDIISDKLGRLHRIQIRFAKSVNYLFYMINKQTGETITNIPDGDAKGFILKQASVERFDQWEANYSFGDSIDIKRMLTGTDYEVYAAVADPLQPGDVFYDGQLAYFQINYWSRYIIYLLVASIILISSAFIYLAVVTGRREKGGAIVHSVVDSIYTDVYSLLVLIAAAFSIVMLKGLYSGNSVDFIIALLLLSVDVLIGLNYFLSMIRKIKSRRIVEHLLIYKLYTGSMSFIKLFFNSKVFKGWILLLLFAYGIINVIFGVTFEGDRSPLTLIVTLLFNGVTVYFAAYALLSLSQIMKAVKEVSSGSLDYHIDNAKISPAFSGFAHDIQNIQGGLKQAVFEAVKGERMKTDLITNVSHDLKTPLTSIINYVDLLKQTDLKNQEAVEYIGILEEKSGRLKHLIEDLIEASKASSGNLTVNSVKVDLHELALQACGEYEEKLRQAKLDIRISTSDTNTLVFADGKYMWRIVENLLSNVIKYSMPYSRVYINIDRSGQYGMLTIKNISALPLDHSPEQLTERFVRGDVARTTEGSGLGLSIAQSLTNILGGRFKIEIDGDLFKVMVEIPLWTELQSDGKITAI
jgi:signal transduction histidine kinase